MNKHKLVPMEPTQEMVEAAEEAHMPFGDMDLALRMAILAAPTAQGEPVAWIRKWSLDGEKPTKERNKNGRMVYPMKYKLHEVTRKRCLPDDVALYTASQPVEQKPGLTEAMRQYQHNDGSGLVVGYDKLLVDQHVAGLVEALESACEYLPIGSRALELASIALAAHREQREGEV